MLILKIAGLIAVGAAAGLVTATGLFALISSIGLINRYADVTDTKEHIMLYEEMIIIGAGLGNICRCGRTSYIRAGIRNIYRHISYMSCRNCQGTSNTYAPCKA